MSLSSSKVAGAGTGRTPWAHFTVPEHHPVCVDEQRPVVLRGDHLDNVRGDDLVVVGDELGGIFDVAAPGAPLRPWKF